MGNPKDNLGLGISDECCFVGILNQIDDKIIQSTSINHLPELLLLTNKLIV
tara:strand:- start:419 stop:571 length:153 start_codon:yes stop_codon:yes gene_type:complete